MKYKDYQNQSPLRSQPDYNERTANAGIMFDSKIDAILKKMKFFQYGCVYMDGEVVLDTAKMDENDGTEIYIQRPKEFWNREIGMCHDASVFIDALMKYHGIGHKCCYIASEIPPHYPTHSFIIASDRNEFYRVIDVFSTNTCVYPNHFSSMNNAIRWRVLKWVELDNSGDMKSVHVFEGDSMPKSGCGFVEFHEGIMQSFNEIKMHS